MEEQIKQLIDILQAYSDENYSVALKCKDYGNTIGYHEFMGGKIAYDICISNLGKILSNNKTT